MSKFSFAALLASFGGGVAAASAAPAPTASGGISAIDLPDGGQGYAAADVENLVAQAHASGVSEGTSAERERTSAVLASTEAQANVGGAAFALANTDMPADKIVASLPSLGSPATAPAPAAAAPSVPAASALSVPIEETPSAEVGAPAPAADTGADGGDAWASFYKAEASITSGGPGRLLS